MNRYVEIKKGLWLAYDAMNMWIEEEYTAKTKDGKENIARRKVAGYASNLGDLLASYECNKLMQLECETIYEMAEKQEKLHEEVRKIARSYKVKGLWK